MWLKGNYDAMLDEQKRGALLFFGKAGCYRCHYEPNLFPWSFTLLVLKTCLKMAG
ncbi:MAG: hypothetical protein IPL65_17265 [Lewinellaceae bacterium]|nr:hypothetical protein [Lewinellaceae bacterium]